MHPVRVTELQPSPAVSVIDTDLEVILKVPAALSVCNSFMIPFQSLTMNRNLMLEEHFVPDSVLREDSAEEGGNT